MKYYVSQITIMIYEFSYAFIFTFKFIQIFPPQITPKSFLKVGISNIFHFLAFSNLEIELVKMEVRYEV